MELSSVLLRDNDSANGSSSASSFVGDVCDYQYIRDVMARVNMSMGNLKSSISVMISSEHY